MTNVSINDLLTKFRDLEEISDKTPMSEDDKICEDILHVGPILQTDLVTLIMRWRFFKHVFNADITKKYRQIFVHPEDAKRW